MPFGPGGLRWEPAVYEHKAALVSRTPAEVSTSVELLVAALIREEEGYQADAITVGVDVYNVEAEALGAVPTSTGPTSCPEIRDPVWSLDALPVELEPPHVPGDGRFALLLEAANRFRDHLAGARDGRGRTPTIRVAASGPVSIAAKLVGAEDLLVGLFTGERATDRVLEFATEVALVWIAAIRDAGHEAIVFESSAAPPLVSPELYESRIAPLHARLMQALERAGQTERPLIIGGDAGSVVASLCATGANSIICDYSADLSSFVRALGIAQRAADTPLVVRCNFDPRVLTTPPGADSLDHFVKRIRTLAETGARVGAGTGIIPYDHDPESIVALRNALDRRL